MFSGKVFKTQFQQNILINHCGCDEFNSLLWLTGNLLLGYGIQKTAV